MLLLIGHWYANRISIHAPHEGERPPPFSVLPFSIFYFNPRSPRGGATWLRQHAEAAQSIFQSTLPTRGSDRAPQTAILHMSYFNPRSPRGGATNEIYQETAWSMISIHAPHEGERRRAEAAKTGRCWHFNPRSPRGGATSGKCDVGARPPYFNPRSPRGGATQCRDGKHRRQRISIHAPHEGERPDLAHDARRKCISIHAPHEGERLKRYRARSRHTTYFNPRSPRGGATIVSKIWCPATGEISIHAPHEGERPDMSPSAARSFYFNPRSPRGGATSVQYLTAKVVCISIHAPHEGERRCWRNKPQRKLSKFQSTLPTRGSDLTLYTYLHGKQIISIHAPHEGERLYGVGYCLLSCGFQSTLPTRGSDSSDQFYDIPVALISIHAPHEGERLCGWPAATVLTLHFNPRSPRGGATAL